MSRINTNVSSLIAQTRLTRSQDALQQSLTRLSTGLRINSGKDDPAGLIASEALRSDITATGKAIANSEKANQLIATADSALGQISSLLNDVRGLVTEAANVGVLSDEQIAANQLQVDSSLEAIDRISQVTTFQGRKLLDGSLDFLTNVSAGASSISDLNIQQANLGSTGSVNVAVNITAAAQQALITNSTVNYTAGAKAAGTLTFSDTPAVQATTGGSPIALTSGNLTVAAKAGGAADGVIGNSTDVVITDAAGITQASGTVTLTGGSLTITAAADSAADGIVGNTTDVVVQDAADIVQATDTFAGAATTTSTIQITAVAGGAADGAAGNIDIVLQSGVSTGVASFAAGVLTVNVAGGSDSFTNIANAITADGRFTATATAGGAALTAAGDLTTYNAVTSNGSDGTTTASYNSTTNTITVNAALNATLTDLATQINGLAAFNATATNGAAVYDHTDNATFTDPLNTTAGASGTTTASYNSTTNTITVAAAAQATQADIASAIAGINGGADFTASSTNPTSRYTHADNATFSNPLSGGVDALLSDVITITSTTSGTAFNGTLTFAKSSSVASGAVDVQTAGSNITVTVNNNSAYDLTDLAADIQSQLSGYTVALTGTAGDGTYTSATDGAAAANLAGGTADGGTGLAADIVFKLSGQYGSEVFNFNAGTGLSDVVAAVNLVKDATGVQATINGTALELRSTTYGTNALADVEVISEGTGGTFGAGLSANRDTGTDIAATVNGFQAQGSGNTLSINTATLDLNVTVADGSSTDLNFSINGGGALFQLGPDVVTNQQARIGVGSVNTAKLGGVAGRLYELRSGNAADLATDASTAANIVDQAITKVTELRGRLGAFQRTTIESNIASLNDTLSNLSAAESSIRDADFASESAALTRAQILVQAGTAVLQIANQNPQNVLALLRQ
jgi:flagellin